MAKSSKNSMSREEKLTLIEAHSDRIRRVVSDETCDYHGYVKPIDTVEKIEGLATRIIELAQSLDD